MRTYRTVDGLLAICFGIRPGGRGGKCEGGGWGRGENLYIYMCVHTHVTVHSSGGSECIYTYIYICI